MSALSRNLLRLFCGLPPDPADADELGRIFDATPLYGTAPRPTEPRAESAETEGAGRG